VTTTTSEQTETPAAPSPPEPRPRRRWNVRGLLEAAIPLAALVLLVFAASACERWMKGADNSHFLTAENILNVLRQLAPIGVVALGMTFAIIAGGIDLSVGSLVALAGGAGIWMMNVALRADTILSSLNDTQAGSPDAPAAFTVWLARQFTSLHLAGDEMKAVYLAFGATMIVALLAGLLNGLLIAKGKLAPFIATLGGFAAYRSLALALADGGEFRSASSKIYPIIGTGGVPLPFIHVRPNVPAVLPYPVIVFVALAVLAAILLNKTRYGRHVIAIGSNERSAVYSAINVARVKVLTYVLVGFACGAAAILVGSRLHSVSSAQTGNLYELDAIAAVVIGGTRMSGGSGTIFGTVIGVLILGVIGNMLNFLDVSPYLQGAVKGAIIVVAALIQQIGRRSA
jgi:ribose transport system permease protein